MYSPIYFFNHIIKKERKNNFIIVFFRFLKDNGFMPYLFSKSNIICIKYLKNIIYNI